MIKYIQIENFKSLKCVSMKISNITLLFGLNSAGKSSVIQAINLLRQSYWENRKKGIDNIYLNGDMVNLGTINEVLNKTTDEHKIRFVFMDDKDECTDVTIKNPEEHYYEDVIDDVEATVSSEMSIFGDRYCYIGAEHIGPQLKYSMKEWNRAGSNIFGVDGKYVVPFLAENGETFKVPKKMCLPEAKSDKLIDQVTAWMSKISPGIQLRTEIELYERNSKLIINYSNEREMLSGFTPISVGFGISYVLPIIVVLLISASDAMVLLENPESHLHPGAQSWMADLISRAAQNGAQIICESHSDHIINGVRLAVKKKTIKQSDVSIKYFNKDFDQNTNVINIDIDKNGNLSEYPKGLLDEWGSIMSKLVLDGE